MAGAYHWHSLEEGKLQAQNQLLQGTRHSIYMSVDALRWLDNPCMRVHRSFSDALYLVHYVILFCSS